MNKFVLNYKNESYPVDVYDMSIEDVEERNRQKVRFKTAKDAANFLGIVPKKIYERIGVGKYAYHRETGKQYAVRKVLSK